jgi:hypothetical protein
MGLLKPKQVALGICPRMHASLFQDDISRAGPASGYRGTLRLDSLGLYLGGHWKIALHMCGT